MKHLFLASSIDSQAVALDIFRKIGKNRPLKTLLIGTATEDKELDHDPSWLVDDKNSLRNAGFELIDFTISGKSEKELYKALDSVDVVFVSGGNTFYLLQESQKTGFIKIIREKVEKGLPYIGSSAGSVIAGPNIEPVLGIDDANLAPEIKDYAGYNLVNFTILPHWGSEHFKNSYLNNNLEVMYKNTDIQITLNNDQYIEVVDDQFRIINMRSEK